MLRVIYEVNTEQLFTYFFATNASIYPYSFIQYFSILHGENLIAEKKQKSRMQKQSSILDRCNFFFLLEVALRLPLFFSMGLILVAGEHYAEPEGSCYMPKACNTITKVGKPESNKEKEPY